MSVASCSCDIDLWAKSVIRAMQGLQWRPIGFETQIDGIARPLYDVVNPAAAFRALFEM